MAGIGLLRRDAAAALDFPMLIWVPLMGAGVLGGFAAMAADGQESRRSSASLDRTMAWGCAIIRRRMEAIDRARDEVAESDILREQLLALIDGVGAHMPFDAAVADFPDDAMNRRPPNVPYTPWHLLEHIRIAQRDILDYIRDRAYLAPDWPEEYWPARDATATPEQFARTLEGFRSDRAALKALVADPATDLLAPIPNTPGHTILREIRLLGDHNAYHVGEFAILRQVMGTWPPGREE